MLSQLERSTCVDVEGDRIAAREEALYRHQTYSDYPEPECTCVCSWDQADATDCQAHQWIRVNFWRADEEHANFNHGQMALFEQEEVCPF